MFNVSKNEITSYILSIPFVSNPHNIINAIISYQQNNPFETEEEFLYKANKICYNFGSLITFEDGSYINTYY